MCKWQVASTYKISHALLLHHWVDVFVIRLQFKTCPEHTTVLATT